MINFGAHFVAKDDTFTVNKGGWSSFNLYPRQLADVNGDGRDDIVGFTKDVIYVSLGQSGGSFGAHFVAKDDAFTVNKGGWSSFDLYPRQLGDVNGDGRDDIVGFAEDAIYVSLGQSNGTFGAHFVAKDDTMTVNKGGWSNFNLYPRQLGDVNGDGRDDIVGFGSNGVFVSLGQSDGSFGAHFVAKDDAFTVNKGGWSSFDLYPRQLGDVNGDGRDDIVGFAKDAIYVSLGQSNGTFGAHFVAKDDTMTVNKGGWSSFNLYPRQLGDVNGDGRDDIVGFGYNGVFVSLGQSDGTFGAHFVPKDDTFTVNRGGWSSFDLYPRQLGDVNGDGLDDVVGFAEDAVFVSLTRFGFNNQLLTDFRGMKGDLTNLIVGDYNGDGKDDFIRQEKGEYANDDINTAQIYLSNGDGSFIGQLLTDFRGMKGDLTNLIVGDYNGDGKDDFIRQEKGEYANDDINTAQIYLSNGDGSFTGQLLTDFAFMSGDVTNLILGDYNGDGKDDFIRQEKGEFATDDFLTAQIYLSNGDGSFTGQLLTDFAFMSGDVTNLIVGDYNGDGKDDFIRQEKGEFATDDFLTAQIYLSNGDGSFTGQLLTDFAFMSGDVTNLIVGDYNGDGKDDFIRQEKGEFATDDINTAQIYLSNGDGSFTGQLLTDFALMSGDVTNLIVGDYNGDGKDDFIRQEKGEFATDDINTAQIYLSNGNGTFNSQDLNYSNRMNGDFTNLILGNFNGDGKDDFIRQEKGAWDDNDILTAEVYISSVV
jgi:hypothetical protein